MLEFTLNFYTISLLFAGDYLELTGETLYERNYDENNCLINLINQIEDVKSQRLKHGAVVYYCESKKSHHINKMIDKQKVPNRKRKLSVCKKDFSMEYKKRRESKGQFYGYDFLGDDFFMSVCSYEFGLNFERNNYGVLSVGNNISGMTLREASRMVMTTHYLSKRLIVNIGSVDLMNGRDIMDMKFDFLGLMAAFEYRGIEPIITTLAPLANYCHMEDVRNNLLKFNHYLMSHKYRWNVVDIHSTFVSNNGCTLFSCYQP